MVWGGVNRISVCTLYYMLHTTQVTYTLYYTVHMYVFFPYRHKIHYALINYKLCNAQEEPYIMYVVDVHYAMYWFP